MKNGPPLWEHLLDYSPDGSALMGGAVVDYTLGIDPKDFDVYYDARKPMNWVKADTWEEIAPQGPEDHEDYDLKNEDGTSAVFQVRNYDWHSIYDANKPLRVQLIGVSMKPTDFFKTFDHSLTRGLYTRKGMFIDNQVFWAKRYKTIELLYKRDAKKSLERAKAKVKRYDPLGGAGWLYLGF